MKKNFIKELENSLSVKTDSKNILMSNVLFLKDYDYKVYYNRDNTKIILIRNLELLNSLITKKFIIVQGKTQRAFNKSTMIVKKNGEVISLLFKDDQKNIIKVYC